jgi:agmatinase/guanidinopropionase
MNGEVRMDFKPISGREFPRFSAIKTFFRLPQANVTDCFDVAIYGVPFDGGVSYRPGARFAPAAVRNMSSLGRGYHMNREVNFFEKIKVADIGDCSTVPIDLKKTYKKIESHFGKILKSGKRFISVGGDHSTTLPVLRAVKAHTKKPVRILHFDAHLDTYPAAWDCEYHHGSFLRHAVEENLVDPKKSMQIGIRGPLAAAQDLDFVRKHKFHVTTVDDVRMKGLESFIKSLPKLDSTPTYLSFDIDCLDPAYAPGTGTPVPGGLTTYEAQRILRALKIPNLIGADIVEVSPAYDTSEITQLAAVDVMFELLCLMAAK